jgi:hypothetical protein
MMMRARHDNSRTGRDDERGRSIERHGMRAPRSGAAMCEEPRPRARGAMTYTMVDAMAHAVAHAMTRPARWRMGRGAKSTNNLVACSPGQRLLTFDAPEQTGKGFLIVRPMRQEVGLERTTQPGLHTAQRWRRGKVLADLVQFLTVQRAGEVLK